VGQLRARGLLHIPTVLMCALATLTQTEARADNFSNVYYDAANDQLVVTMTYQGTSPNHTFSLQWGQCSQPPAGGGPNTVVVDVMDNQWNDHAVSDFSETVRFSLGGLPCRPAMVTLRTAPHWEYTLMVPAPQPS
jgi:hypothetical protein